MSEAIDPVEKAFRHAINFMIAEILEETHKKDLLPADTVELAIRRGMAYQHNVDKTLGMVQAAAILGKYGFYVDSGNIEEINYGNIKSRN